MHLLNSYLRKSTLLLYGFGPLAHLMYGEICDKCWMLEKLPASQKTLRSPPPEQLPVFYNTNRINLDFKTRYSSQLFHLHLIWVTLSNLDVSSFLMRIGSPSVTRLLSRGLTNSYPSSYQQFSNMLFSVQFSRIVTGYGGFSHREVFFELEVYFRVRG